MKPFPEDPSFVPGTVGFDDNDLDGRPYDLLGRKAVGQRLTDLLDRVEQPLVIALDGGWGSGKSHFLKLWTGAHQKELGGKAKVIYFDAFEHDYLDDPLISLVARMTTKDAEATWGAKAVKAVKKAAYPLARFSLRVGTAVASAGVSEVAGPVVDTIASTSKDASQAAIDTFWKNETNRINAMQQFRESLSALTAPANVGESPQKIVFIIDELDRCRPDYALTLLEIVKHFFAVPNVHFVLGANFTVLEGSVRSRYGSEINATEYLAKFVHLRMSFPTSRDHQGNGLWASFYDEVCAHIKIGKKSAYSLKANLSIFAKSNPVSFRDIQRLTSRLALFPSNFENYEAAYSHLATSALIMAVMAPRHFERLRSGTLEINQVLQLFPVDSLDKNPRNSSVFLKHLWSRVLMPDPGAETMEFTKSAFDRYSVSLDKDHFDRLWADLFDTFQIPAGPT